MSKVRKTQSPKSKPNKRKKSSDQLRETPKKAKNDILLLFQKQKEKFSSSEIVISDDSSDFVAEPVQKNNTSTKSRVGLVEKTNLPGGAPNSKTRVKSVSWLTAAQFVTKESHCVVDSDETQPDVQPPAEDNMKSCKTVTNSHSALRPCTPVLFDSDSDSDPFEIGTGAKKITSSTEQESPVANFQICVDPYSLLLTSFSDSDEFSTRTCSVSKTDFVDHNTSTDLCSKSETGTLCLEKQATYNTPPKVVVLDGVKKQSTITSFFGGNTTKLKFVDDVPCVAKSKASVKKPATIVEPNKTDLEGEKWNVSTRTCPFYKKIPGTSFAVDAFSYGQIPGIEYYFLSHFHSDHYMGLNKNFHKPIFCTQVTANLVALKLRVNRSYLKVLTLDVATTVDGIEVTPMEANHCPGAAMFVFHFPQTGRRILHTGDFRFHHSMTSYKPLQSRINQLFLDTTYLNPSYNFPAQDDVVSFVRDVVTREAKGKPRVLVVTGSYTIGKEKVFMAAAEVLDCRVWTSTEKQRVLNCLEEPEIKQRLTTQASQARVHVLPMQRIGHAQLRSYLDSHKSCFHQLLAFKPTGWTHAQGKTIADITPSIQGPIHIYSVPYSEHSSFAELEQFVKFLRPDKITPTVNVGSPTSRSLMNTYIQSWLKAAGR